MSGSPYRLADGLDCHRGLCNPILRMPVHEPKNTRAANLRSAGYRQRFAHPRPSTDENCKLTALCCRTPVTSTSLPLRADSPTTPEYFRRTLVINPGKARRDHRQRRHRAQRATATPSRNALLGTRSSKGFLANFSGCFPFQEIGVIERIDPARLPARHGKFIAVAAWFAPDAVPARDGKAAYVQQARPQSLTCDK